MKRTLSQGQRGADMETRQRLQENHTQTDTLDGVQDSEPKPETGSEVGSDGSSPGDVEGETRRSPEHLTPSRTTETNCEDTKDPRVRL